MLNAISPAVHLVSSHCAHHHQKSTMTYEINVQFPANLPQHHKRGSGLGLKSTQPRSNGVADTAYNVASTLLELHWLGGEDLHPENRLDEQQHSGP